MNTNKSIFPVATIIFLLAIACLPVILSANYLRQDDLMWEIWPNMKISDFGFLYYNTVYQIVRPLCMLSFYLTDLISINIHDAVYVRFLSVVTICILGIMLYQWQIKFNSSRLLATTFAICTFTLPPYQIFVATQNYFLILTALLMTFTAVFYWYCAFENNKRSYLWIGNFLFFCSLLNYPLSSMFVWALLGIYYLNILNQFNFDLRKQFFYRTSFITIGIMIFYYVFCVVFHYVFNVDLGYRSTSIETQHLFSRCLVIFDIMSWHSNFWFWDNITNWTNSPIALIWALLATALYKKTDVKTTLYSLIVVFGLFFLAYSPIFASAEFQVTFRYAIVTMPILLYLILWSLLQLSNNKIYKSMLTVSFSSLTIFAAFYSNYMIADGIVGPQEHDFQFIQNELNTKVLPLVNSGEKVIIHALDCDEGRGYKYPPKVPTAFEYGMRFCAFQQQIIGVIFHSMTLAGHLSNFNKHNTTLYKDKSITVKNTPWGDLIVTNGNEIALSDLDYDIANRPKIVTINTNTAPIYQHLDFYHKLMKKFNLTA